MPLVEAVKARDAAAVRMLLKVPNAANVATADGTTPLHVATDIDDVATAQLLLRSGANVKAANRYGVTPMYSAAVNGSARMIELLLDAGADPNVALREGETALMTASRTGVVEAMRVLLARGAKVNAKETWKQQTALMWAAHEGNVEAVKLLLEAGAQVKDRSLFGWTPLLFAARQGEIGSIEALLGAGADIDETLPDGTSALVTAVQGLNYEAAAFLAKHGIDPNASAQGWTALHQIAWSRRPQRGQNNPGQKPQGGVSSLELAKILVEHGADVNARQTKEPSSDMEGRNSLNRYGATPLFLAAKSVDVPLMETFLALGADPFLANIDGDSPLMVAAGVGVYSQGESPGAPEESADAVKMLLKLGAAGQRRRQERRNRAARACLARIERGRDPARGRRRQAGRAQQPWLAAADDRRRRLLQLPRDDEQAHRDAAAADDGGAWARHLRFGRQPRRCDPLRGGRRGGRERQQPVGDPAPPAGTAAAARGAAEAGAGAGQVRRPSPLGVGRRRRSRPRCWWRVAIAEAQRRGGRDNSAQGLPVATNTILANPDAYYGKLVTVSAGVDAMLSKTVFLVDQWKAAGTEEAVPMGKPILVIAPVSRHGAGAPAILPAARAGDEARPGGSVRPRPLAMCSISRRTCRRSISGNPCWWPRPS